MKTTIALASILGVGLAAGGATLLQDRTVSTPKTISTHLVAFPELRAAALSASSAIAQETPGCLRVSSTQTICPLRHTDVKASISGIVARVTVTQLFEGPKNGGPVEAVYSFPLPENAAVDDMTIKIGKDRIIQGSIKRREEARTPSLAKLSGSRQKKAQLGGKERVKVALTLQQLKPDTLARLQRLGFVLTKRQSTQVWLGTITANQLVALAQLEVLQSAAEPR